MRFCERGDEAEPDADTDSFGLRGDKDIGPGSEAKVGPGPKEEGGSVFALVTPLLLPPTPLITLDPPLDELALPSPIDKGGVSSGERNSSPLIAVKAFAPAFARESAPVSVSNLKTVSKLSSPAYSIPIPISTFTFKSTSIPPPPRISPRSKNPPKAFELPLKRISLWT